MKTVFSAAFSFLLSLPLFSQTEIGGVVNTYTKVTAIDPCEAVLITTSAAGLEVGEEVLLIQMQGAEINESNSSDYGDVTDIGGAGFYERNEVLDIVGNQIFLKYSFENEYDPAGSLQLVGIPIYNSAIVEETLTAENWDGETGGVLALRANTLILDADIDVSGQGFRGGQVNVVSSDCTFLTNADGYHYSITNWRGAPKGEGIALPIAGKEQGRGAQANGGGGGNDHNSGGGGGANVTQAGEGGKQSAGGFNCDGDYPGERGKAIGISPNRIFMGGGGGAGHVDNAGFGTPGGNGGGIVILLVDEIFGNGFSIKSNGTTPNDGQPDGGDGQGGGGAGGTIVLDVNEAFGLHLELNGGDGGSVNNPSDRCFGPGGGGSGGHLMASLTLANADLAGGQPGVNTTSSGQCSDPSSSADEGQDGVINPFPGIPFSNAEIAEIEILAQPEATEICEGQQVTFTFSVAGPGLEYLWQFNDGSGWQPVLPGAQTAGIATPSLTFFAVQPDMDGWQVRCLVTGPCTDDILSLPATLTVLPPPVANFSFANLGGGMVQFTNLSVGADGYLWDFGDTTMSEDENPLHIYMDEGQYTVSLTIFTDCGEFTVTQTLNVATPPSAGFSSDVNSGCVPLAVQFFDQSMGEVESLEWLFPGAFPNSSFDENPSVIYPDPGVYEVTLIATNTEGSDTLTLAAFVNAEGPPVLDFDVDIDLLTVQFINLSQNVVGDYMWDFGDMNFSMEQNPEHTYANEGFFDVTLTASNDCGESIITQTIATGQFPLAHFSASNNNLCAPATVTFTDLSSGTNLSNWQWGFEGGIPATSVEQNPTVMYENPGIYNVSLTVTNAVGQHINLEEGFITVISPPQPDFNFTVDGLTVFFNNTSSGATNFFWNFDDGESSMETDPVHEYDAGGIYSVTLNAIGSACASAIAYDVFLGQPNATGETAGENGLLVFPNPTSDILWVKLPISPAANAHFQFSDLSGKILRSGNITSELFSLDLSDLPGGVYVLEILDGEKVRAVKVVREP